MVSRRVGAAAEVERRRRCEARVEERPRARERSEEEGRRCVCMWVFTEAGAWEKSLRRREISGGVVRSRCSSWLGGWRMVLSRM